MKGITHFIPKRANVLTSYGKPLSPALRPRFRVLVWNIYKAKRYYWARDFLRLVRDKDLALLQEAFLRPAMLDVMEQLTDMRWDLAAGFTRRLHGIDVGVMTGCRAQPRHLFFLRSPVLEPLIRLPKMTIGTSYYIDGFGSDQELLVLNVHAINFVRINRFKRQMRQLEEVLGLHDGPLLMAGDFNTWLTSRSEFLQDMTGNLNMDLATFSPDRRSRYFGHALDHVFVRGLKIISAACHYETYGSDHRPIELVLESEAIEVPKGKGDSLKKSYSLNAKTLSHKGNLLF